MMRDHLFCHGNGDPLREGSPLERAPSLFFPPPPKSSSNPDASAPALSTPIPGVGDSPEIRGPQARHSSSPARPSPARHAQEIVHPPPTPPSRHPESPGNPFYLPLTVAKTPQSPQTECLTRPGNPPHLPFALGQSPPHPRRWSPSRGFHPESPQESSPPVRRLLRLLLAAAVAGSLHSSSCACRTIPDLLQTRQPPSPPSLLGRETPARSWILTGNKSQRLAAAARPPPTPAPYTSKALGGSGALVP